MKSDKRILRSVARVLICALAYQLAYPLTASALTSGPSQPEVQSFEPVGTTDMVDVFSGDFVYNIPLLDVEGYPINISYHGGSDMESEASWVGLGWNINPGVVNHTVRGIPDDFKGDSIKKELHIEDEKNVRIAAGVGVEVAGVSEPLVALDASLGAAVNISNYRGVSVDINVSAGINVANSVSAGVNMGVGSQSGADIDLYSGYMASQKLGGDVNLGIGFNTSHGYNTRSGLKDLSFSVSSSLRKEGAKRGYSLAGGGVTVPIGVKNIVPVITNRSSMMSIYGQIKFGLEGFWIFGNANINAMSSTLHYDENGSRKGYGYLYLDEAKDDNITDFTRDRDGMFNKTMQYLAPGNTTYDLYSVNGQGTGGSFRPFRNDFGSVYDPFTRSESNGKSGVVESGLGWNFEVGFNATVTNTDITSGPWNEYKRPFKGTEPGNIYESTYFKQAGEMSSTQPEYMGSINGLNPLVRNGIKALPQKKTYADSKREPRGNMMYFFNADEASKYGVASSQKLYSYTSTNGFAGGAAVSKDSFSRIGTGQYQRKAHQISEVVQVQTNGSRYVYGIPAMNNIEKEVTFSIDPPATDSERVMGVVSYIEGVDDGALNGHLPEKYYSASWTPSYAHSYLLTSVLSPDYVDVTGNGTTDDDLGSYTKFNYTCKDKDYRWRAPYQNGKAQHNPGFRSDPRDDKALYTVGSREQWMLHSVESKNFVAEFYTSERKDGRGVTNKISGAQGFEQVLATAGKSYKLDSIRLYNKHDRFVNLANAVPVKTVIFEYDYSLCPYVPNIDPTAPTNTGKLTLRKIYMRYGNSDKSMISPYQFNYSNFNPRYNLAEKDRWGCYKPSDSTIPNYEFPFVNQAASDTLDMYAGAWSLTEILLPSGGSIKVNYEADDYAYVQDKPAMEMFRLYGIGNSTYAGTGSQLFFDKNNPNLYLYFKRRLPSEKKNLSLMDNYFKGVESLYMNFNIALEGNKYEVIKGYAAIEGVGRCSGDTTCGYVKVRAVKPKGGGATLHPMTYTALNIGRFNLPHIIYPGSNPNENDLQNILTGLGHSIKELINFFKNPLILLVKEGKGKNVDLGKSYVRLSSPGMKKKGGGQRVKSLLFYDNWTQMAGGAAQTAQYGKQYDYTKTDESGAGTISSGVASYEPQIGGDENPFRMPVKYEAQNGSTWPPNDPIELYQELPIGESLYPSPTVGYSKVTVKSIHQDKSRSSQGVDIHEFYTARDFPVEVRSTALDRIDNYSKSNFIVQENVFRGSQGYTLIMNDMHGKPRRTEHRIIKPQGGTELVSYTQYHYKTKDGKLNNDVQVLVYDEVTKQMKKETRPVGMEVDVTIDTRKKYEKTVNDQFYMNTNTSSIGWFVLPIPLPFYWYGRYSHEFCSAVATKTVQQYGILEEVESYEEGALTRAKNEVFDPITGQPLLTSINNEFRDREYTLNYPAYWGYKGMGPAYENIGYTDQYPSITASNYVLSIPAHTKNKYYRIGDELLVSYKMPGDVNPRTINLWIVGFERGGPGGCCNPVAAPRRLHDPSWVNSSGNVVLSEVNIKVVRSGNKNQLGDMMQTVQAYTNPLSGTYLSNSLSGVVSISAREYGNEINGVLPRHFDNDSFNPYINGRNSLHKLYREYAYLKNRDYTAGTVRNTGMFDATSYFVMHTGIFDFCLGEACQNEADGAFYASYMKPQPAGSDPNWVMARTVTQWAPFGQEAENKDALGNYTAAAYGYNNELPVSVASNARQQEVLAEGFEDYRLLQVVGSWVAFSFSPFRKYFNLQPGQAGYGTLNLTGTNGLAVVNAVAHSGFYSLRIPAGGFNLPMDVLSPASQGSISSRFYMFNIGQPKHMPFALLPDTNYIVSYWTRPVTTTGLETAYNGIPGTAVPGYPYRKKSNIIEGWQQVEARFKTTSSGQVQLALPANYYVDDIRIFPVKSNMKAFVYHPFNEKLMATLDENNFATFYEYDQEGNLIRTKRETEKGIMTISESRSANPKK